MNGMQSAVLSLNDPHDYHQLTFCFMTHQVNFVLIGNSLYYKDENVSVGSRRMVGPL
jgi:hypothetical protein